jgi:pimeloyl-ACP methyl ester carboxylesterase
VELGALATRLMTPRRLAGAPSTASWETQHELETPAGAVTYWSAGNGAPVLLVHGWEGTHADLDAFVEPLLAQGHRVVALDLPAHGASGGTSVALSAAATALLALGTPCGPFACVVAHSFGCPATAMALERGLAAERVALVATPARYESFVRTMATAFDVDGDALVAAFAAQGVDVTAFDLPRTARGMAVPALLVHSDDDRVVGIGGAEAVAAAWAGSRLVRVHGLGHNRILRDPAVVETVVRFVNGQGL